MKRFHEYLIDSEIKEFGYDFSQELSEEETLTEKLQDIPIMVEPHHAGNVNQPPREETPKTGVPKPEHEGGNHWKNVRAGAQKYFNASPEEQHAMRKEADKVFGKANMVGKEKSNPKLAKNASVFGSEASNPKLAKSGKKIPTYKTIGLSLAPSTMSGIDVCPAATKECKAACLGTAAGRGRFANVRKARIDKTNKMFSHPHLFYANLDKEITSAKKSAHKEGQKLAVRLNVLSDIPHEHLAPQLFDKHKDVSFYDYSKITGRANNKKLPSNYHLTLSSTGVNHPDSNWGAIRKHLDKGGVAAMAFKVNSLSKSGDNDLPSHVHDEETGKRYRVIDGDEHDHRHLDKAYHDIPDHEGVIAGLRFKGGNPNMERAGNFAVPVEHGVSVVKKGQN